MYKLYSLQLNCTNRNYTEAAATCSAAQQHSTFTVQNVQSATELYLKKLHRSSCYMFSCTTAQNIYCKNCTVCNSTVLRVIKQKLPLHVQLHKSTAHLLHKHRTSCKFCNRNVLSVITQKLLLHVQLHNRTAH